MTMTTSDGKRLGPPGIIDINTDLVERRRERGGEGKRGRGGWVGAGIKRRVLSPLHTCWLV